MSADPSCKYVLKPRYPSSHWYLRQWLAKLDSQTRVLDVGTADGVLGRLCADLDLLIWGVEPVSSWADRARGYYEDIANGHIEEVPDDFLRGYDAVVLADVIEHLTDPKKVLRRLVALQEEDAVFIVSVPNVANVTVRLGLLFGRFDYQPYGILDESHLHFYTRKTLGELLSEAGLQATTVAVTAIPLDRISPFFGDSILGRMLCRLLTVFTRVFPTLLGYQFVVRAARADTGFEEGRE